MGRSILAVVAGYAVVALATVATFGAVGALVPGAFASLPWLLALVAAGYVTGALGGYVTAAIARRSEIDHALVLGVVMALLGVVSMVFYAGKEPLWFQVAIFLVAIPAVLTGAFLRVWRKKGASERTRPA